MSQTEMFSFHPETNKLISSISNNYPKKHRFLMGLIGLAFRDLDKIRIKSLRDKSKLDAPPELFIRIIPDKTNNTLTIVDSGIGMTKADLVNLHTVKWSTHYDLRFYLAYLVAEKVIVTTKHNDDEQYVWESQAGGLFTITRDTSGENLGRGTKTTLFLKEYQLEYLEESQLKDLIKKHSMFISYPIYLWIEKTTKREVSHEWSLLTKQEHIWKEHFAFRHFSVQGPLKIKASLFVPKRATSDTRNKPNNIRLYVLGDFLMDNCEELIPQYLGFVKGVLDIQDLPNDFFREMFQTNGILQVIRKNLVQKTFELFYEIAMFKEEYNKFYEAFSKNLKIGMLEDSRNKGKIAELLRYHSTKSGDEMTSLKDYVTRMKEGHNDIYYIIGDSKEGVENSPCLEKFKEMGYEVLFMVDAIDEDNIGELKEFEGKKFVSATKEFDGPCKVVKDVLGDKVEDVGVPGSTVEMKDPKTPVTTLCMNSEMVEPEIFPCHPDINKFMSIIKKINTQEEVAFLPPLIRKAICALDEIRFESWTYKSMLDVQPELFINIIPDKTNNTLTIVDNGIGMNKAGLVKNLGRPDFDFCKAYQVAEKVIVTTKHDNDQQYVWEWQGGRHFMVTRDTSGKNIGRGTKVTLFLKEDQLKYLDEQCLKYWIEKHHSEFIGYPISLWVEKTTEKETSDDEDEEGKVEVGDEVKEKEKKQKKIKEVSREWYLVNEWGLIWKEQFAFKQFYVEGSLEIKATLFVPKWATFDLRKNPDNIRFYFRGRLIKHSCEDLIPHYLGFINTDVYFQDRPPILYKDLFQWYTVLTVICKDLVKKSIELFYEIAETKEDYKKFYEAFSWNLKSGILEDPQNKVKIAELLRYHSTKSGDEMTSLNDYVATMKEVQNDIYYIIGASKEAIENSPFLEKFKRKGYEVLFMVDTIDKHVVGELKEFESKKFVSATLKLDDESDELREKFDGLCQVMKDVLGEKVEDVVVPDVYVHSHCCIVTGEHGVSEIMKINPEHPTIKELMNQVDADKTNESVKDFIYLLYNTANFNFLSEVSASNIIQHD